MHLLSFWYLLKMGQQSGHTGQLKEMCKNSISVIDPRCAIYEGQFNWFNMGVESPFLPTRPINPQQAVNRHIHNLPRSQSAFSPHFKTSNTGCRGQRGKKEDMVLEKIPCVEERISSAGESCSFILHHFWPPSLAFSRRSLLGEEEDRREERSSLSLRPECLAVFKWRTRTCFCLPRQIHCGGRWANTHTHILTSDTDLCVLAFVSMQAGNQVISYEVSGHRASLWQPT